MKILIKKTFYKYDQENITHVFISAMYSAHLEERQLVNKNYIDAVL